MKKPRLSTVLVGVLFLVGAGVMLYPTMSDLYVRRQLQKELAQYNQVTQGEEADYSELWRQLRIITAGWRRRTTSLRCRRRRWRRFPDC